MGQTIALVDAFNDPNISSDLATFDAAYGLQAPPLFTIIGQTGTSLLATNDVPGSSLDWTEETSLDVG